MNFDAHFETQEPKVGSAKTKIILGCLTAIFIICGVLMAIFHPEAEFTWLFGEVKYFLGLFILAALFLFSFLSSLGESRDEKYYFTADGKLDLSTPRYYTKLKRHKLLELITKKGNVNEFAYDGEGNIYIKFKNGEELTAPLKDLTVSYSMDKDQISGDLFISKMKITTPDNLEYKIKWGPEIEDAEFQDIFMILSTAGTLKEPKMTKAIKWMSKLKDAVDDFDFSDLVGSGIVAGTGLAASIIGERKTAENNVISFIKSKVYVKKKKKSWFKKILQYFWYIVLIIYLIAVLIVNIAALPEIFGGVDKGYDDYIEELADENSYNQDALGNTGPSKAFLELIPPEYYSCRFDGGDQFYLSLTPECGEGVYQAPSGNLYTLIVEEENDDRTEFLCSVYDDREELTKMVFYLHFIEDYERVEGNLLGTDGETMFSLNGILIEG